MPVSPPSELHLHLLKGLFLTLTCTLILHLKVCECSEKERLYHMSVWQEISNMNKKSNWKESDFNFYSKTMCPKGRKGKTLLFSVRVVFSLWASQSMHGIWIDFQLSLHSFLYLNFRVDLTSLRNLRRSSEQQDSESRWENETYYTDSPKTVVDNGYPLGPVDQLTRDSSAESNLSWFQCI